MATAEAVRPVAGARPPNWRNMDNLASKHANTLVPQTLEETAKFSKAMDAANEAMRAANFGPPEIRSPGDPYVPNAASQAPELNPRARAWLKWMWRKTTTPDDWSAQGTPAD